VESKLEIFRNHQFGEIRTVIIDSEPWFVLKDLCIALEIQNSGNVYARLDEDEKGIRSMDTLGGKQEMSIVSESGFYNVVLRSDKPEAKQFKRWVTKEVIPQIRKTGSYGIKLPEFTSPALAARAWAEAWESVYGVDIEKLA
jgi:prophage antirepressor-like protein